MRRFGLASPSLVALRGMAEIPGNSTANARHSGRKIRRAWADAANNSAISGALSAACNCAPNPAA